ncbi:MAG: hypothetical protein IJS60_08590 [Abditibacteriota bacterium]|nr:hypothetical protein [Abditibacteriota bacterium]
MNTLFGNIPIWTFIIFFIVSLFILGISIFFRFLYNVLQLMMQINNQLTNLGEDIQSIKQSFEGSNSTENEETEE